jgi:2-succinyl-5-enolpyruvyl-6-hydroxy-3-cyclohexene-1-carboxylate synthase
MSLDYRNINSLCTSIIAETLVKLGLKTVIICPGSRSTPLAIAFSQQQSLEFIPILDERSAAFFALGIAKRTHQPVVIVCTSGTAAANFYPAIIEAKESRVSLLVLTADRPPEMRYCHSGQTIDQVKLYGDYCNYYTELTLPDINIEILHYFRQTIVYSWERSLYPVSGVVHLNIPFRDPLAPLPDHINKPVINEQDFFAGICKNPTFPISYYPLPQITTKKGIIIVGTVNPKEDEKYITAIANLAKSLCFPVLAEGLSPVRNYKNEQPYLISTYDVILRNSENAKKLQPEIVLQIGDLPTSKELRNWLSKIKPITYIIDESDHNLDPLHNRTNHLRVKVENLQINQQNLESEYLQTWLELEKQTRDRLDEKMSKIEEIIEPKTAWILSQKLPKETPIFIANSMSVRNVEFFWRPNNLKIRPYFNRGANGIDGTLSTSLGIAQKHKPSVLLTGDLALLHDTNGFLITNKFQGHLTIILINNNGGGIFENLPIAKFDPPFEELFATPQNLDFKQLCQTYKIEYHLITNWRELAEKISILPDQGVRILEIQSDRKKDAKWLKENLY